MRSRITIFLLTLTVYSAYAQNQYATWVFGDRIKLSWYHGGQVNRDPILTVDGVFWSVEGTSMISSSCEGDLLLQSDGNAIADGRNNVIPSTIGLCAGPSSTQNCIFIQKPGSASQYYLVAAENLTEGRVNYPRDPECNEIGYSYSLFDISRPADPLVSKNVRVNDDVHGAVESIAAAPCADGNSYWIVTGSMLVDSFRVYRLSDTGMSRSPVLSPGIGARQFDATWKFSPDSKKFVTSDLTFGTLYDFDWSSGEISNPRWMMNGDPQSRFYQIVVSDFGGYQSRGTEFSPDSRQLYLLTRTTRKGDQSKKMLYRVLQFDVSYKSIDSILNSVEVIYESEDIERIRPQYDRTSYMQLGLDGRIWINVTTGLDVIEYPNRRGAECGYFEHYFVYPNYELMAEHAGLPTIVTADLDLDHNSASCRPPWPNLLPDTICVGECADLDADVTYPATSFVWSTPGGTVSGVDTAENIRVCYDQPGEYTVILTTGNDHGSDQVQTTVVVLPRPTLTLSSDTVVCYGQDAEIFATGAEVRTWDFPGKLVVGNEMYLRFTPVNDSGMVYATARSADGRCSVVDSIPFVVSRPVIDLPLTSTVCQGATTTIVAMAFDTVTWYDVNGVMLGSGDTLTIRPSTSMIVRAVTTTPLGCRDTADHQITVIDPLVVTADGDTTICPGETATLTANGGVIYRWEPAGAVDDPTSPIVRATVNATTMFFVTVSDTNGCSTTDSVLVEVNAAGSVYVGADTSVCDGQPLTITAASTHPNVEWVNAATSAVIGTGASISITPTVSMRVIARLPDVACSRSDTISIIVTPRRSVTAAPDTTICVGSTVRLVSSLGKGAVWFTEQGIIGAGDNVDVTPQRTTQYRVTADCADTAAMTVYVHDVANTTIAIGDHATSVGSPFTVVINVSDWLAPSYTTTLSYDGRLLQPTALTGGRILSTTGLGSASASSVITLDQGGTHELKGNTWLAPVDHTTISADDIINDCGTVRITPGTVTVTGCGLPQRSIRTADGALFTASYHAESNTIRIDVHATLAGECGIALHNMLGECRYESDAWLRDGSNAIDIDVRSLPPGLYVVLLHNSLLQYRSAILIP